MSFILWTDEISPQIDDEAIAKGSTLVKALVAPPLIEVTENISFLNRSLFYFWIECVGDPLHWTILATVLKFDKGAKLDKLTALIVKMLTNIAEPVAKLKTIREKASPKRLTLSAIEDFVFRFDKFFVMLLAAYERGISTLPFNPRYALSNEIRTENIEVEIFDAEIHHMVDVMAKYKAEIEKEASSSAGTLNYLSTDNCISFIPMAKEKAWDLDQFWEIHWLTDLWVRIEQHSAWGSTLAMGLKYPTILETLNIINEIDITLNEWLLQKHSHLNIQLLAIHHYGDKSRGEVALVVIKMLERIADHIIVLRDESSLILPSVEALTVMYLEFFVSELDSFLTNIIYVHDSGPEFTTGNFDLAIELFATYIGQNNEKIARKKRAIQSDSRALPIDRLLCTEWLNSRACTLKEIFPRRRALERIEIDASFDDFERLIGECAEQGSFLEERLLEKDVLSALKSVYGINERIAFNMGDSGYPVNWKLLHWIAKLDPPPPPQADTREELFLALIEVLRAISTNALSLSIWLEVPEDLWLTAPMALQFIANWDNCLAMFVRAYDKRGYCMDELCNEHMRHARRKVVCELQKSLDGAEKKPLEMGGSWRCVKVDSSGDQPLVGVRLFMTFAVYRLADQNAIGCQASVHTPNTSLSMLVLRDYAIQRKDQEIRFGSGEHETTDHMHKTERTASQISIPELGVPPSPTLWFLLLAFMTFVVLGSAPAAASTLRFQQSR
ncbi:MAG: hypothetical protein Q9218_004265 [Villophora microphyllina]